MEKRQKFGALLGKPMERLQYNSSNALMHLCKDFCKVLGVHIAKNLARLRVDVGHVVARSSKVCLSQNGY